MGSKMNCNGFRRFTSYRLHSLETCGTFSNQDLSIFLNVPSKDWFSRLKDGDAKLLSTLAHEIQHWYQHVTTPYGAFTLSLQEWQLNAIRMITSFGEPSRTVGKPICRWLDVANDNDKLVFSIWKQCEFVDELLQGYKLRNTDYLAHFINQYFNIYDELQRWFEGPSELKKPTHKLYEKGKKDLYELYHEMTTKTSGKFGQARLDLLRRFKEMHENTTRDKLIPIVNGSALGARQLMEGAARISELLFAYNIDKAWGEKLRKNGLFGDYSRAFEYFAKQVGNDLLLFLATCELSLNSPIHPIIGPECLLDFPVNWQNLHPGWRFLKICNILPEVLKNKSKGNSLEQALEYMDDVCEIADWPKLQYLSHTVSEIETLFDFSDLFASRNEEGNVETRRRGDLILWLLRKAGQRKADNPFFFVIANLFMAEFETDELMAPYIHLPGGFYVYCHEMVGAFLSSLDAIYELSRQLSVVDGPFDLRVMGEFGNDCYANISRSFFLYFGLTMDEIILLEEDGGN